MTEWRGFQVTAGSPGGLTGQEPASMGIDPAPGTVGILLGGVPGNPPRINSSLISYGRSQAGSRESDPTAKACSIPRSMGGVECAAVRRRESKELASKLCCCNDWVLYFFFLMMEKLGLVCVCVCV